MEYSDNPAEIEVTYLKGVGPKKAAALKEVSIVTIQDLLFYFPRRYLDRSKVSTIASLEAGMAATVIGEVKMHGLLKGRKQRYEVLISDETESITLLWFGGIKFLKNKFKRGMTLSVSGEVRDYHGLQITHPDFEILFDDKDEAGMHTGAIIPLYPSTAGLKKMWLDSRGFRRIIKSALDNYTQAIIDIVPETISKDLKLGSLSENISQMHYPADFKSLAKARQNLVLRELFLFQLIVLDRRFQRSKKKKSHIIIQPGVEIRNLVKSLPFKLTQAQNKVIAELTTDLLNKNPMQRLLQGDVGSGKTVVAAITLMLVAASGYQIALMAPTGILARQHCSTLQKLLGKSELNIQILTGSTTTKERKEILAQLQSGKIDLLIGTHALISKDVKFNNLAYVIVDEQHRFGVEQRDKLLGKGKLPDLLVMTATPIPRTMALTAYGDLDLSVIDQLPQGRKPIRAALRSDSDRPKIYKFIRDEVDSGNQVFIIYPIIEDSEKVDLRAAKSAYKELSETIFPDVKIGLVHGQIKQDERGKIMQAFAEGEINILVSTTVVEVGIDIPDATVILIENAERFGLSQLHQLRGRVGRSDRKSYCILLTSVSEESESYLRLKQFVDCSDGFKIAELDLALRGPGDLLGIRQSGIPFFKVADLLKDSEMIVTARDYAYKLLENPSLLLPEEKKRLNSYIRDQRIRAFSGGIS